MADKAATDAAKKEAQEKGMDLSSVEGSGSGGKVTKADVAEAEEKFLVFANPSFGSWKHSVMDEYGLRDFYRDPNENPAGPQAQMLTAEEYDKFNDVRDGASVLLKVGE